MATHRSHTHTLALSTALLLSSSCQPRATPPADAGMPGALSARAPTTEETAAAGRAGSVATSEPASAPTMNTGSAANTKARPAANGGAGGSSTTAPLAGSGGSTPAASPAGAAGPMADSEPASNGGRFPSVSDFKAAGPFSPKREAGPAGYVLFYPEELGRDGVKHPILSWGPGAVETASDFVTLLSHVASHGFAVISFDATPQGQELVTGIDFLVAENMRADSVFYQKLDDTKISAGGHSAGSLATFAIGADKRLVTTLHISGGTFEPHTDIMNLHAPALFVCGEPGGDGLLVGDVAHPNCEIDFENAMVPVFYGITKGASHMTPTEIGDAAIRTHQLGAIVGWLRWQLVGDANARNMFAGDDCTLCSDPAWSTAKPKNLN